MEINSLRGFKDVILADAKKFNYIIDAVSKIAELYNYQKSYFPIMEYSSIYQRTLGESSDIVNKEMYSFTDKSDNQVTMRPEFTAGIVRAVISNKLYHLLPLKFFTYGSLFRYERPQQGRQRQFNQINFEVFGIDSFYAELELIMLIEQILSALKLNNKVTLELNSLGSNEARSKYKDALTKYYQKYQDSLSSDSQKRLQVNPLRILDSKDSKDQEINQTAPILEDFFTKNDYNFFQNLIMELNNHKIEFKLNNRLVRGLDYYTHTVFEYSTDLLGAQNAVFAGGRYDKLVEIMGGKPMPAIGFAGGIERIAALTEIQQNQNKNIIILPLSDAEKSYSHEVLNKLRSNNIKADIILAGGNLSKKLKKAAKFDPEYVAIIGENELLNEQILLKNFNTGLEQIIKLEKLIHYFAELKNKF